MKTENKLNDVVVNHLVHADCLFIGYFGHTRKDGDCIVGQWGHYEYSKYTVEPTINSVKFKRRLVNQCINHGLRTSLSEALESMSKSAAEYKAKLSHDDIICDMLRYETSGDQELRLFLVHGKDGHMIVGVVFDTKHKAQVSRKMSLLVEGDFSNVVLCAVNTGNPRVG